MLSEIDTERIEAEARASAVAVKLASESFAAGPMIREIRDLLRVLPDHAGLHAGLGFCMKRIEKFDEARASLSKAESLLRARSHIEIADKLWNFSERLKSTV